MLPPPPPRVPTAAFAAAAVAQGALPLHARRPTLHLAVAPDPRAPLAALRLAHRALADLARHGVQAFLQTELACPARGLTPVPPNAVQGLAAASPAHFFAFVSDIHVPNHAVSVRLPPSRDFVQLPVADLPRAVLAAWAALLPAHRPPTQLRPTRELLAANPNVVTDAHIDAWLAACSRFPDVRRAYTVLLRLVPLTHDWLPPPPSPRLLPNQLMLTLPLSATQTPQHSSDPPCEEAAPDSSPTPDPQPAHLDTTRKNGVLSLPMAPEQNLALPVDKHHRVLCENALRNGLRIVNRSKASQPGNNLEHPHRVDLSFCWLRRSNHVSAHLLRSQLLTRKLHESLVATFDTISGLPIADTPFSPEVCLGASLPTAVHRQRLLREVNELLPRVEELGKRLSKRPRANRLRYRPSGGPNPWSTYVEGATAAASDGKGRPDIAGCTGDLARAGIVEPPWKCSSCGSFNERRHAECMLCEAPCCDFNGRVSAQNPDDFRTRFHEALNATPCSPTPWVFAPAVFPIQPPLPNGLPFPNGPLSHAPPPPPPLPPSLPPPLPALPPRELRRPPSRARSPTKEDESSFGADALNIPIPIRNGSHVQHLQPENLNKRFESMTIDEPKDVVPINGMRITGAHGHGHGGEGNMPSHSPSLSRDSTPPNTSPVRLATSAPNSHSFMEFDFSHRRSNGRIQIESRPELTVRNSAAPPSEGVNEQVTHHQRSPSAVRVGSLPESETYSGALLFAEGNSKLASAHSMYGASLRQGTGTTTKHTDAINSREPPPSGSATANGGFRTPAMDELAAGSFEAVDDAQRYTSASRRVSSSPIAVPGASSAAEPKGSDINSLKALAAASDAANGGTGSATRESLRAVSAVVSAGRGHSTQSQDTPQNGMYNMF